MRALIVKDLRLYLKDRKAMVIGIAAPILIAAFFGYVFGGNGDSQSSGKLSVAVVDEDQSEVSRAVADDLRKDSLLEVATLDRAAAETAVRAGKLQAAAVMPAGFGADAVRALFSTQDKPRVDLLIDPSQAMSAKVMQGLFTEYGMQEVSKQAFSGPLGRQAIDDSLARLQQSPDAAVARRPELVALLQAARQLSEPSGSSGSGLSARGLTIPYELVTQELSGKRDVPYNGYAHSFAGMAVQFILLAGIDAGIVLLLTREQGIWRRLQAAPLHKGNFLAARAIATTLISLFQFVAIYVAAMALFHVSITHFFGFALIAISFAFLNASFGLMLASIGGSAQSTRGLAVLATLLLVMLGGAWVPSFVFPRWLQQLSLATPTRWAVDGLDAMTWRAQPEYTAFAPAGVLCAAALACLLIAIWRFRWTE
jgi:ABC-2 type transport system permease protein